MLKRFNVLSFCFSFLFLLRLQAYSEIADSIPSQKIFTISEETPVFPKGKEAMSQYIDNELQYPIEAIKNRIEGTVYVKFKVLPDGSLKHIHIIKGLPNGGFGINEEALRIVKSMPKWIPGKEKGVAVTVVYTLPIKFQIDSDIFQEPLTSASNKEINYETLVDEMPTFIGGQEKLFEFFAQNTQYPISARLKNIEDTVYVGFIVMSDGSIEYVDIKKGISDCEKCNKEALRVVSLMPDWKPGKLDGLPVNVAFTVPVRFKPESSGKYKRANKKLVEIFDNSVSTVEVTQLNENSPFPSKLFDLPISSSAPAFTFPLDVQVHYERQSIDYELMEKIIADNYTLNTPIGTTEDGIPIYGLVSKMPTFFGGRERLSIFLSQNLILNGKFWKQGLIYVNFVVMSNGGINNIKITYNDCNTCKSYNKKIIRLIRSMPRWNPGEINGKPVNVALTLPIQFKTKNP